jgi:hypothetical protein
MTQQPGDEAGEPARGERAQEAAEKAAQHTAHDEYHHQQQRQKVADIGMPLPFAVGLGQGFAIDHGEHPVDAGLHSAVVIAGLEVGRDDLREDAVGRDVRQRTLQSPADLDPHRAIILGDQQDGTVVDALAPELPRVGDANPILLDVLGLRRRHDQDRDLTALFCLEGRQLPLQAIHRIARQRSREVDDPRRQRRHGHVRPREHHRQQQEDAERRACRAKSRGQCAGAGAGAGPPKSTVGGLAISASFSTVKFGFG